MIKSLVIYWVKVRELWVLYERVLRQFSVSPRIHAPIFPKNYKTFSMWLQNKDKTKTQNALCNFSKSPHMCKLLIVWLGALCGLCIFALYINGLWSALVGECSLSYCFMRYWLVWALRAWERERVWRSFVFVSVDVKYIINYKRMCKFMCSL